MERAIMLREERRNTDTCASMRLACIIILALYSVQPFSPEVASWVVQLLAYQWEWNRFSITLSPISSW